MVYVIAKDGTPLMPTKRHGKVRRLLKEGFAKVAKRKPFTIQLLYESEHCTQPLYGGTDTGRTNIGNVVIDESGDTKYADHVETRNKEIPGLMRNRKQKRQASRRGNREVQKRRAIKNDPSRKDAIIDKYLAKKKGPVACKVINGDEARFNNRRRPAGWKNPTTNQLVQTHLNQIDNICAMLPVTDWCIEWSKFAFMRMEDGSVVGTDFQNGRMKGYASVNDYVYARQGGKSFLSDAPIEHYHHVVWRSRGGSDGPENIVGITEAEHEAIHKGELKFDVKGFHKKYQGLSVLNSAMWDIYTGLIERFGVEHVHVLRGYDTFQYRKDHNIEKTHTNDAYCIANIGMRMDAETPPTNVFEVKQFRRHDRQIVRKHSERSYKLDGKTVCQNRHKRTGQDKTISLEEYRKAHPSDVGRLTVVKSQNSKNNVHRHLPGLVFLHNGVRYVLRGTQHNGERYYPVGLPAKEYFLSKECQIMEYNRGLVYL